MNPELREWLRRRGWSVDTETFPHGVEIRRGGSNFFFNWDEIEDVKRIKQSCGRTMIGVARGVLQARNPLMIPRCAR